MRLPSHHLTNAHGSEFVPFRDLLTGRIAAYNSGKGGIPAITKAWAAHVGDDLNDRSVATSTYRLTKDLTICEHCRFTLWTRTSLTVDPSFA